VANQYLHQPLTAGGAVPDAGGTATARAAQSRAERMQHSADQPSDAAQKRSNTEAPTMNATHPTHDSTDDEQQGGGTQTTAHPFAAASVPTARDAIVHARDHDRLTEAEDAGSRVWFRGDAEAVRAFAAATQAETDLEMAPDATRGRVGIRRGTGRQRDETADRERAAAVRERLLAE
jgi:hypothetical protein